MNVLSPISKAQGHRHRKTRNQPVISKFISTWTRPCSVSTVLLRWTADKKKKTFAIVMKATSCIPKGQMDPSGELYGAVNFSRTFLFRNSWWSTPSCGKIYWKWFAVLWTCEPRSESPCTSLKTWKADLLQLNVYQTGWVMSKAMSEIALYC